MHEMALAARPASGTPPPLRCWMLFGFNTFSMNATERMQEASRVIDDLGTPAFNWNRGDAAAAGGGGGGFAMAAMMGVFGIGEPYRSAQENLSFC